MHVNTTHIMHTPDVVTRNLFALLRCAVLHHSQPLEPMSVFKWRRLLRYAANKHVAPIVEKALLSYQRHHSAALPPQLLAALQHMPQHQAATVMQVPETWLSNMLLNRHLKRIRRTQLAQPQPPMATLHTLNIIIYSYILSLNQGFSLHALLCLAKYVQTWQANINFTLLNQWLHKLGLASYAQLMGSMLTLFLGFNAQQLPFVQHINMAAHRIVMQALPVPEPQATSANNIKFWQSHLGIVHNNSTLLSQSLKHTLAYAHYAPLEAISNYLHNIKQNLANLEE